ncbi:hypothetical protein HY382_00465 [Candidatus Curtissbacteria bacterium]|nr:hypothetical protein [Candidatus Curtissbacteria bacterium]
MKLSKSALINKKTIFFVFFIFSLFTFHFSLFTSPTQAYEAPLSKPCQDPKDGPLTDNYITDEAGEPQFVFDVEETGPVNTQVTRTFEATYQVDFSKLQAIFGPANSNYQEGRYQDDTHRLSNVLSLPKSLFNKFHGAAQKTTPKLMLDTYKVAYIKYILEHPGLPEASAKYSNTNGADPFTIYELITQQNFPNPPNPPSQGGSKTEWQNNWGKYWEKVPTAYREFYNGKLDFRVAVGDKQVDWALGEITDSDRQQFGIAGPICLDQIREIRFVMPEFSRTVSVSDNLNKVVVPCVAQSWRHAPKGNDAADECKSLTQNPTSENQNRDGNILAKVVGFCQKLIKASGDVAKKFRDAAKVTLDLLNPVKNTYAAASDENKCFALLNLGAKEGSAPFCALPAGQLQANDRCIDKPSENKLDKDNPRVICEFKMTYQLDIRIDPNNPRWNSCIAEGAGYRCTTKIRIFPNFRIPFLAEIWNNTTYSEEQGGVQSNQKKGRPGIYSAFTPKTLLSTDLSMIELNKLCENSGDPDSDICKAREAASKKIDDFCTPDGPFWHVLKDLTSEECRDALFNNKVTPGKAKTETGEQKQRFIGAADCNKFITRDLSLKPKALQEYQGIESITKECLLQTSNVAVTGPVDFDDQQPPPGTGGGCGPTSSFASMLPNPIPQSVNAQSPNDFPLLADGRVITAAKAASEEFGVPCEILVAHHYVEDNWDSGSFISGRDIGAIETDVTDPVRCANFNGVWAGTGCKFATLQDTANYAADLIIRKFEGWYGERRAPRSFEEMILTMALFNGFPGNANCRPGVPYTGPCPPPDAIDNSYVMNRFDERHSTMYLIFCSDGVRCPPGTLFQRDGAATVAKEFYLNYGRQP